MKTDRAQYIFHPPHLRPDITISFKAPMCVSTSIQCYSRPAAALFLSCLAQKKIPATAWGRLGSIIGQVVVDRDYVGWWCYHPLDPPDPDKNGKVHRDLAGEQLELDW